MRAGYVINSSLQEALEPLIKDTINVGYLFFLECSIEAAAGGKWEETHPLRSYTEQNLHRM